MSDECTVNDPLCLDLRSTPWLWPSVLSLDAPLVAVIWQLSVGKISHQPICIGASFVLFLSVWLTYAADRLLDVKKHRKKSLKTIRHQWTLKYYAKLWQVWSFILLINLLIAFNFLEYWQLKQGFWLLGACLLYTLFNQLLSQYWFPKEALVGIIFSAGNLVFHNCSHLMDFFVISSTLFFLNCLIISLKERDINSMLNERSIATVKNAYLVLILVVCTLVNLFVYYKNSGLILMSILTLTCLGSLYLKRNQYDNETYRIIADICLLPAPIIILLLR